MENQSFRSIRPEEIKDNVFQLVGNDFFALMAGTPQQYDAMVGSGGGFIENFRKPSVLCLMREDRYTLELLRKQKAFTMCFFAEEYKEKLMYLGSKTGRGTDKMRRVELTVMELPSGALGFEEARLILECELSQIMTADRFDYCSPTLQRQIDEAHQEGNLWRKYVFGEIASVWIQAA